MSLKTKINALLVDDELSAINNLSFLLGKYCPSINVVATANNVDEAVLALANTEVDVVFLDIEMPEKSGFELFEETNQQFQTIFVTAYDEYAIKAFEVSAIDYLLKPTEIERLQRAVNKLKKNTGTFKKSIDTLNENINSSVISKIVIPFKDTKLVVKVKDIICFEANASYCTIYCENDNNLNTYVYSKSLSYFHELLNDNPSFYRTHRSWLVNLEKIQSFSNKNNTIKLNHAIEAFVSKSKVKEIKELL